MYVLSVNQELIEHNGEVYVLRLNQELIEHNGEVNVLRQNQELIEHNGEVPHADTEIDHSGRLARQQSRCEH